MSCVASVGGVSIEAEARMGEAGNPDQPYTCHQADSQVPTDLAADFFDTIDPERTPAHMVDIT